jgi:SsrA-binding protein
MRVINRKARRDYRILETLEAGIELKGPEVKSTKEGRIDLGQAYVRLGDDQVFLLNAHIAPYPPAGRQVFAPTRTRRLLLHKKEITALKSKMARSRLTLVPVSCYTKRGLVKLEIGLARGKKRWQKREDIKKRDLEREVERELREGM